MIVGIDHSDVFELSGPVHLCNSNNNSNNNNNNQKHKNRHALMAGLVQSVYVAEKDRQQGRHLGPDALAPSWWRRLGYELVTFIGDEMAEMAGQPTGQGSHERFWGEFDDGGSGDGRPNDRIIGAIFENVSEPTEQLVVAFRGTMISSWESMPPDMSANVSLAIHQLHRTRRFAAALRAIRAAIEAVGSEGVAVAGHSLGAALALLGCRAVAEEGMRIEAHLFNPPFPTAAPIERIVGSRRSRLVLNVVQQAAAAAVSGLLLGPAARRKALRSFLAIGSWFPHLYVNAGDPICSSYIGFFSCHELMRKSATGGLGFLISELSAPLSLLGALQSYAFGECEASHLVPCAHLFCSVAKPGQTLLVAHGLRQWWAPTLEFEYRRIDLSSSSFCFV